MKVRFIGPFRDWFGDDLYMDLPQPITVQALLTILSDKNSAFGKIGTLQNDAELSGHLAVFKAGRLLRLDETLSGGDEIYLMLPATGG